MLSYSFGNAVYLGVGFALAAHSGWVLGNGNPWAGVPIGVAGSLLIIWVRARQGTSLRPDVLLVGGCGLFVAYGLEWIRGGRAVLGTATMVFGAACALIVLTSQTSGDRRTSGTRGPGSLIGLSKEARGRGSPRSGPLVISPGLDKLVRQGEQALRSDDWPTLDRTIKKLLAGRIGLSMPDDVPAALIYAAEFLSAREESADLDLAEALSDEAAWWVRNRAEVMTRLQLLRAELQVRRYRSTDDRTALYLATVMKFEAVERMDRSSDDVERHAGELVNLLLEHFRATAETESLDRAERVCRAYPKVGERYLSEVQTARSGNGPRQ